MHIRNFQVILTVTLAGVGAAFAVEENLRHVPRGHEDLYVRQAPHYPRATHFPPRPRPTPVPKPISGHYPQYHSGYHKRDLSKDFEIVPRAAAPQRPRPLGPRPSPVFPLAPVAHTTPPPPPAPVAHPPPPPLQPVANPSPLPPPYDPGPPPRYDDGQRPPLSRTNAISRAGRDRRDLQHDFGFDLLARALGADSAELYERDAYEDDFELYARGLEEDFDLYGRDLGEEFEIYMRSLDEADFDLYAREILGEDYE